MDQRITRVNGYNSSPIGYSYIKIQATDSTADGAMLINSLGRIQGIRMPTLWLLQQQVCAPGEVCAVDAAQVGTAAIPALRTGRIVIRDITTTTEGPGNSPPALPIIFYGHVTNDGADVPENTQIYARLKKPGQPDYWESAPTEGLGLFSIPVSAPDNQYAGAVIEFWLNGKLAGETGAYDRPQGSVVNLNLAF